MSRTLSLMSICLFFLTGILLYAFVYDVEPIPPEKQYAMERSVFDRSHDGNDWSNDFPTFSEWLGQQEQREANFHEWLQALSEKIGHEAAASFDFWYVDTRESQGGAAPDNWITGERD